MNQNEYKNIRAIHDAFDSGSVSPLTLTETFLERAQKSQLNTYLEVSKDRALKQAKRASQILEQDGKVLRKERPLFGIPIAVKDLLTVEGTRTTCGSKMLENYSSPYTATAVRRLEDAGAVILGKLNLDEFAMGSSNENSAYGAVLHPTHSDRVPGGSSGGSASAVRAGECVAALGTDTGGSIRLPASFCGVVGFKPTYGRVSRYGLTAFASSLDQIGPLANSVEDAARILDVIVQPDPLDSTSAPVEKGNWLAAFRTEADWKKIRVGVPAELDRSALQPEVRESYEKSLDWVESQGAKIEEVELPHSKYAVAAYYLVAVSEASSNLARFDGVRYGYRKEIESGISLRDFYEESRSRFGPEVKRRLLLGTFALSSGYYDAFYRKACQVRNLIRKDYLEAFKKVDVILGPVSPTTAFRLDEKKADPLQMYLMDVFTCPANLAGVPALSLPSGKDGEGLPIGLQFVTSHFREDLLIQVAHAFEKGFSP